LATARVVIVTGADDHFTLQVHIGMSPEELESLETELSIIVLTAGVGIICVVSGTSTIKEGKLR